MTGNKCALAVAVAASLGGAGSAADAATYPATLTQITQLSPGGSSAANITSSTVTFAYDDVTKLLTQTGGVLNARLTVSPTSTLFRHLITGAVIGNGGAASASTFVCQEGNFGALVVASICGNYNFGANFLNESTASWGPGTAFARTLGGDDGALGPQQSLAAYDGFATVSWVGTTLKLSNANPFQTSGYTWTLSAGPQIPVPAAVWLFGSALGLLGAARRKFRV